MQALIAEDEPLLAAALQRQLKALWPALETTIAADGATAVQQALAHRPALLFLDIRMPGIDGLEAAAQIAESWGDGGPLPLVVFVTAHDEHALAAFALAAVDYVQKPVQPARLAQTVARLRARLSAQAPGAAAAVSALEEPFLAQLRTLLSTPSPASVPRLQVIQAAIGNQLHLIAVEEVLFAEAADKYVRIVTRDRECLLRTPIRELQAGLDPAVFWQIHRGTLVRATAIERVTRDAAGRQWIHLRGCAEKLAVSRIWGYRFRAM